jgi:hypothetical protein
LQRRSGELEINSNLEIVGDLAENSPSVGSRNVHTRMIIISGRVFNFLDDVNIIKYHD